MMKRILYCSAAQQRQLAPHLLADISAIVIERRRFNATHDITGFFCFRNGYYLEAIEGPDTTITRLYQDICHNSHHKDVIRLLEEGNLASRYFQNWSLNLSTASSINNHITSFLEQKWPLLQNHNESRLNKIQHFYNADKQKLDISFPRLEKLHNFKLKMLSLPYTNPELPGAHDLLDIYAHLLTHWTSIADLQKIFAFSTGELYQLLYKLYSDNLLSIRKTENYTAIRAQPRVPNTNTIANGFYHQLRSFFLRYA